MSTKAGQLLLMSGLTFHSGRRLADHPELLAAIEAEAVAAERARITAAVEAMFGQVHPMAAIEDEPTRHDVVSRKAVLAIVEEP